MRHLTHLGRIWLNYQFSFACWIISGTTVINLKLGESAYAKWRKKTQPRVKLRYISDCFRLRIRTILTYHIVRPNTYHTLTKVLKHRLSCSLFAMQARIWQMRFHTGPTTLPDVEHDLRTDEQVLRYVITKHRDLPKVKQWRVYQQYYQSAVPALHEELAAAATTTRKQIKAASASKP